MDPVARLRLLRDTLTTNGAVTFTRADLSELLGDVDPVSSDVDKPGDLTVQDVAEKTKRHPNTVRDWIRAGKLKAYQLNGHDYWITPANFEAFLQEQREGKQEPKAPAGRADLGRWRNVKKVA